MAQLAAASSSKALAAILPQIAEGHAYEAHQKARTFAARYVKSHQYDTAIDVLFQSARELLKAGQLGSGTDLFQLLLDVYQTKGELVTDESRGRLTQLMALTGPSGAWRKTMSEKAIAWTVKAASCTAGDASLQHYVGELLYKEGSFAQAELHFLSAGMRDSARLLAKMYIAWLQAANDSTSVGAFALRGTLPYLNNGNILAARAFLTDFISLTQSTNPPLVDVLPASPLTLQVKGAESPSQDEIILTKDATLNFLQLAIRTCQRAEGDKNKIAREAWIRLSGTYASKGGVLAHPEVRKALITIATLFFAIPAPRSQSMNPLGDMFSSLLGAPSSAAPRVLTPNPTAALD